LWQGRDWSAVAAAVVEPPLSAEDDVLAIGLDAASTTPGETIGVRARLRDEEGNPIAGQRANDLNIEAEVIADGRVVTTSQLSQDLTGGGLFTAQLESPKKAGTYAVRITSDLHSDNQLRATAQFAVTDTENRELRQLSSDADFMHALAKAGSGIAVPEHRASELTELLASSGLTSQRTIDTQWNLWASWPAFATIVGLLGFEWALRRRSGMI